MTAVPPEAIGGYFELEIGTGTHRPLADDYRFQSARAAFLALLRVGNPERVWVPRYICDAMLQPLRHHGTETLFYSVDDELDVDDSVHFERGDWIVYVDYFGICGEQVRRTLRRFGASRVILDRSQAFFAESVDCLATIRSARKFFGVPDGGLLSTSLPVSEPTEEDAGSIDGARHLLVRLAYGPEAGYAEYQQAEQRLNDCEPRRMSALTERLLESIDYDAVRKRRNENYRFLHHHLGPLNLLTSVPPAADGPLCYPFLPKEPLDRARLVAQRIYVPRYWTEVLHRPGRNEFEAAMAADGLPLPCDQRYDRHDMQRIIDVLLGGESATGYI